MSYRLNRKEAVGRGIRRVADEQISKALAEIDDKSLKDLEVVHQLRKRCKKIRGLLRLVRPQCEKTYQFENRQFRDAARRVAGIRDAASVCECFESLTGHFDRQLKQTSLKSVAEELQSRKETIARENHDLRARLDEFRGFLLTARDRVPDWPFDESGFSAVAGGLKKTYGRGREAMTAAFADPNVERFHEWRKRVKYHWYHVRLIRNCWKPLLQARRKELKRLSDLLGDLHDLAILRQTLLDEPDRYGTAADIQVLLGATITRSAKLAERSRRLGSRLFAEKPKRLVQRCRTYWKVWRKQPLSPADYAAENLLDTMPDEAARIG